MSRLSEVAKIANADRRITKSENAFPGKTSGSAASRASAPAANNRSRARDELSIVSAFLAEQPARLDHQDDGHEEEHDTLGEQRESDGSEAAHQPDQQRPDQCAGHRAHASDHGHDERL